MIDEEKVIAVVNSVKSNLQEYIDDYKLDNTLTVDFKAVVLAELRSAIYLLSDVKALSPKSSKTAKINNCVKNQQLIYLARMSIRYVDRLTACYDDLTEINYYTIPELTQLLEAE